MTDFQFSRGCIDDHVEKIGVDVRPTIECKLERTHLIEFANDLVENYPNLFESTVQSPTEFSIRKKFIFPGKGEMDSATLALSPRGLVFILPRRITIFQEDTDLGRTEDVVSNCLQHFRKHFGHKSIIRVGQINEYIFNLGQIESARFLANRFTKLTVPPNGELNIRINRPDDDYNRIIQLEAVQKMERKTELQGISQVLAYGLKVTVDFNNRDMSQDLESERISSIIFASEQFNKNDLYTFLNCGTGVE
jgi:hypothetical protein